MNDPLSPGLIDHLWQTTLFAVVMALLALALRRNGARVRYCLWFAASVKFLLPFSIAASFVRFISTRDVPVVVSATPIRSIALQIASPVALASGVAMPASAAGAMSWLQTHSSIVTLVWLTGLLAMTSLWVFDWLRMREAIRTSTSSRHDFAVPVRISDAGVEPGIAGIFKPVLILPKEMIELLRPEQFAAVLAHENCHLRRRDNLTAALHRFVQSVFWFHPAVWVIAERLATERERACDEQVLRGGHSPESYAEGILAICELCVTRRARGVASLGGGKLKDRIAAIVSGRSPRDIDGGRKLLLITSALATIVAPIAAVALAPSPALPSVATSPSATLRNLSIARHTAANGPQMLKTGSDGLLEATNLPIRALVAAAYRVPLPQVAGLSPDADLHYDISAESSTPPRDAESWPAALRNLLTTRFGLQVSLGQKSVPGYALRASEGGVKIQPAGSSRKLVSFAQESMTAEGLPLTLLTDYLSNSLGVPVADETGLKGAFTYTLRLRPSSLDTEPWTGIGPALEDQLGLVLERKSVTVEFVDVVAIHPPIR